MKTLVSVLALFSILLAARAASAQPTADLVGRWAGATDELVTKADELADAVLEDRDADDILDRLVAEDLNLFGRYAGFLGDALEEYADAADEPRPLARSRARWRLVLELNRRMRRVMLDIDEGLAPKGRRLTRSWFGELRRDAEELSLDLFEEGPWYRSPGDERRPFPRAPGRRGYVSVSRNRPYRPVDLSGRASAVVIEALQGDIRVRGITFERTLSWRGIVGLKERRTIAVDRVVEAGTSETIRIAGPPQYVESVEIDREVARGPDALGRVSLERD